MAGHSKWAQIKRTKAVVDAKRGAVFTRLGREIMVAARTGADPAGNFQLRTAITKAKAAGVPTSNIERAIAKGAGQAGDGAQLEEVRYEGYGPNGMAILVEALTDNRNRTAADLRLAFSKNCGNLGENGCVAYLFEHRSEVIIHADQNSEDKLLENLLELDADGYELVEDTALVHGPYAALEALQDGLRLQGWEVQEWSHNWNPLSSVEVHDPLSASQCLKLLDALESLDDVRSVSSNLEINSNLKILEDD
ncbi:MAG: YebC/PmpR family DNA-binding transcriptional regulator [Cyanobium sp. NAT70]|nr:YebC/PmpR family DNA-binding transcriptional regulator [Cyanobium sp. NAT70]|tara:strand:+ start:202 stop:954 length:753 start_codon:yes stop_codon:yes gene_type:complete